MRVAPIGLVFFRDMDMALYYAGLSSDVTHPHPRCAECCKIYTKLIVRSLNGASKTDLAAEFANTTIVDAKLKERLSRYASFEDWNATPESDIKSSGYVLSTLEAALWGFFTTDSFREGALKVVNLGYDADTVGAVYGGLAGAFYGFEEIPERWIRELQKAEIVDEIATGLASLGGNNI
jgi:ADP-ribosylglycohydrolase